MDKVGAIICELNPFTLGHKYIVDYAHKLGVTHLVAIMSGDFVQRGSPAIVPTRARAEIALECGFDLVIEIPSTWSMSTAETYARSGVFIAESLGCVDNLIFGSECGNLYKLDKINDIIVSSLFTGDIKFNLENGNSFAKARELSVLNILGEEYSCLLKSPNDILAIEYLKALKALKSSIKPIAVKRFGAMHHCDESIEGFASSSHIRGSMVEKNAKWERLVPSQCCSLLKSLMEDSLVPVTVQSMERAILYKLSTMGRDEFKRLPDISEGLENRIFKFSRISDSLEDLVSRVKSKRYTRVRIIRLIMSAFLGITQEAQSSLVPYIKVLGADAKGLEVLKEAKSSAKLPIVSRNCDICKLSAPAKGLFEKEEVINRIYSLMSPKVVVPKNLKFISK